VCFLPVKAGSKSQSLTAAIYPAADGDWLVAHNPETGTTTQGRTFEEALASLKEATELYLTEVPQATKRGHFPAFLPGGISPWLGHDHEPSDK
jgi:predicted RNase H-like HicB family nuclease